MLPLHAYPKPLKARRESDTMLLYMLAVSPVLVSEHAPTATEDPKAYGLEAKRVELRRRLFQLDAHQLCIFHLPGMGSHDGVKS